MSESSPVDLRINQRRAVILRWWLLSAAVLAVAAAPTLLDVALPRAPMFAVLALTAAYNAWLHRMPARMPVGAGQLFGQLCVDLAALGILLYLSGGAANPLISFLLVPVAVAALSLPGPLTALVALAAVAIYSLLMWVFLPLPVADAERATRLHLSGMWLTFVVSATMIAWFVARMTASLRERDRRLAEAREQALRDERVVALGALAAGAAHELGTPLATIAVVVGELEADAGLSPAAREDLALVRGQVAQCKGIISGLAARTGGLRPEQVEQRDAAAWLRELLARWHAMRPAAESRLRVDGIGSPPPIPAETTLEQALTNLLNNAADASSEAIDVRLDWDVERVRIAVADRGSGFPAEVLSRAGRVPLPARAGNAGIGLLLAFSAVERLGGRILLGNPPGGGGCATVELRHGPGAATTNPRRG